VKTKIRKSTSEKVVSRQKKKVRIRKKVLGTTERPRLSVFRSLKHIYAQVIDDVTGMTVASASTREKALADKSGKEAAKVIGTEIAKRALTKNVNTVVFDRNGYQYHGRLQALAEGAREAGLKF